MTSGRWAMLFWAVAFSAAAQPASEPPKTDRAALPYMRDPDWLRKPTADEVFSVWPKKATTAGKATISCIVTVVGTLRDCEVRSESPEGSGFGQAAVTLSSQFRMMPATAGGKIVEGQVSIPVVFHCNGSCDIKNDWTVLRGVRWDKTPSIDDIAAAYPKRALAKGISGSASVQCLFLGKARLRDCQVMTEDPPGMGFANAARQLAESRFQNPNNIGADVKLAQSVTRLTFSFSPDMAGPDRPPLTEVRWLEQPSKSDFAKVFPAKAIAAGAAEGSARLRCVISVGGGLENCSVLSETPADQGFGPAALALAAKYRAITWADDGFAVAGRPVEFSVAMTKPLER